MGKESLLNAALKGAPKGAKTETDNNSSVNLIHVQNKLARVYSATCKAFEGLKPTDVESKAQELIHNSDVMKLYTKKDTVCDDDFVTVMESLRWTGIYVTTGRKPKFRLALVESKNSGMTEPVESSLMTNKIWNCLLLDDFVGYKFTGGAAVIGYEIKILQKTTDVYEVSF